MKKITSVSKRAVAVFMAVLMLCSFTAVTSFADISIALTADGTANGVTLTAAPSDGITYTVKTSPTGSSLTVSGSVITLKEVKAGTYTFEAVGAEEETGTITITVQEVTITATKSDKDKSLTMSSDESGLTYKIKNTDDYSVNGSLIFNLKSGTAYKVYGYKYDSANKKLYYGEVVSEKLKETQNAPANVKPVATADTITVESISGAEYMLKNEDGEIVKPWQDSNVFTGLDVGSWYTVSARLKATDTKLASESTSVSIKTLQNCTETPKAVNFTEVTKTSLTVEPLAGYEYSTDGKTWSTNNKFTGLTAGKDYVVYQRIAATEEYAPSAPVSKSITTNTADNYYANASKLSAVKWADEENLRVGKKNKFTLYGDIRTDGNIQWGDTRIIPYSLSDGTTTIFKGEMQANAKGSQFTGTYEPASTGEKTITVIYIKEEYKGTDGWKQVGDPIVQTSKITALHSDEGAWGFLVQILRFLTTTLPGYIQTGMKWLEEHGMSFLLFI